MTKEPVSDPQDMRAGMTGYVRAIHEAYMAQARLVPPAARGSMPLLSGSLHIAAAGARQLHVIATAESLGPISKPEVEVEDEIEGLCWTLRFYDPVVLPSLGLIEDAVDDGGSEVRATLGIATHIYHLTVQPGASLSEHQATHAGAGLASSHTKRYRQYESMRQHAVGREGLVDEMAGASVAGLDRAHALLALQLVPGNSDVSALAGAAKPDQDAVRNAVLAALVGGGDG